MLARMSDAEEWARRLRTILDATAEAKRVLDIADNSTGVSDAVHSGAGSKAEESMRRVVKLVYEANAIAARIGEHTLTVPGEAPSVDLRPWWSKLLDKVSSTARRNTAGQQLETLRLEATDALQRASAPR
jgi:hypothetical protein